MKTDNLVLKYKGFFDYSFINKLLMDFLKYVEENQISDYFLKKVQIIMVEMLENNYQYTHQIEQELINTGFEPEFKLLKTQNGFLLHASNPILKDDAIQLNNHLNKINDLDLDELKVLYKETLKKGMHIKKNNAGTGLIRISKVARNKIKYSFRKIDNKLLYYTLEILVNPK